MSQKDLIYPGSLVSTRPEVRDSRIKNGVVVCIYDPICRDSYYDYEWAQVLVDGKMKHCPLRNLTLSTEASQ
jgi:hypothetical protein